MSRYENTVIKVITCTHKAYPMPEDSLYIPVFVGAAGKETPRWAGASGESEGGEDVFNQASTPFRRDDEGENISDKNAYYSELTGLYWAWKNLDADYIGLAHYRRHFVLRKGAKPPKEVLSAKDVGVLLSMYDRNPVFVPQKRNYYIESLYSHYAHTLDEGHLALAAQIIKNRHPAYMPAVEEVYNRRWGYMWNMFLMAREDMDRYCEWLFSILFELEVRMEKSGLLSGLSDFEKRLFGRVSEILFNVWLLHNDKEGTIGPITELPVASTEPVAWGKKISGFLAAKFLGKHYKESF